MIRSMTGFGQAGCLADGYKIQVDIKSVNHRYSETMVRMPREWLALEESVKRTIQQFVKRGRVDAFLTIEKEAAAGKKVEVNWALAEAYREAAEQLRERLGLEDRPSLRDYLQLPDLVVLRDEDPDAAARIEGPLLECLKDALRHLVRMRESEGANLARDLRERLQAIERLQREVSAAAPSVAEEYRAKLHQRLTDLLGERSAGLPDENRLAMEVALFAERSNIDEELTRLQSHIAQCRQLLQSDEPVGRKLDFLIQEMNREVNTIGSKANHTGIVNRVVEMKAELEKMREQVQNVE